MQRKYIEKDFVRKRQRADNSLKGIKRMEEIVIFGWSGVGKKLYKDFYEKGIAVSGICDNSRIRREKIGGGYRSWHSAGYVNEISKCNLLFSITLSSKADERSAT